MKIAPHIFICLFMLPILPVAQPSYLVEAKFYGIGEGLSDKTAHCMVRDRRGFLWIGTRKGLNRFEGYRFKVFDSTHYGFPFDDIRAAWEDADGWLWLFGHEFAPGVFLFDPVSHEVHTLMNHFGDTAPFSGQDVVGQTSTADGALWMILSDRQRIVRYHPGQKARFSTFNFDNVISIGPADSTSIFCRIDGKTVVLTPDGSTVNPPRLSGAKDWVGIGTSFLPYAHELLHMPGHNTIVSYEPASILPPASHLADTVLEKIFVISPGLYLDTWTLYHREAGPLFHVAPYLADGIKGILPVGEDKVWVCGYNGVILLHVKPVLFSQYLGKQSFKQAENKSCRGIWSDGQQLFAHLDEFGLYRHEMSTGKSTKIFSEGNWGHFGLLKDGNALYGGLLRGMYRYDLAGGDIRHWPFDLTVVSMYRLPSGIMLCGTQSSGLYLFDEAAEIFSPFRQYNGFTSLATAEVMFMTAGPEGMVWVCADSGLYLMHEDKGVTARYWEGGEGEFHLPAITFRHIMSDSDGKYWLSTRGHGILIWDKQGNTVHRINHADGLSSDEAYAVYEDANKQCWVSTDYGLNQVDKSTMHLRFWDTDDGVAYNEFNKFSHFRDQDGMIYFGGLDGVTRFDPSRFPPVTDADPEPIQFCELDVFNSRDGQWHDKRSVYLQNVPLELRKGDNLVRIDFALLDLDQPEDIRYSWQLIGLDSSWHQVDYPSVQLSRPPYGKYELKIRAIPSQGIWEASELSLHIHVIPPVYLRPWAWMLALILLAIGIWQYGRWRAHALRQNALALKREVERQTATIRQQTEELKHLDEMKSRFFANVSHDLRTPLSLLLGPVGSVLKKNTVDEADRVSLEMAHNNGQQLMRMVDELLDLGKLSSGTLAVEEKEVALAPLFRRICSAFNSHAARLGIKFSITTSVPDSLVATMDEKKFTAIINNLVSNALKFTPANGLVHASLKVSDHELELRFNDTGQGIQAADLPYIFDRYYRSHHAGMPVAAGSGIGLALCREYTELMGGIISVVTSTQAPTGSTFIVTLPLKVVASNQAQEHEADEVGNGQWADEAYTPAPIEKSSAAVLIVEDHDDLRKYIGSVLSPFYNLQMATDGSQALAVLDALSPAELPALIISDIMMPVMDGFQLAERLKTDDRYRHIPLIMLTARADMRDKLKALRIGVDDYIIKPFEEDELLARMANLLRNVSGRKDTEQAEGDTGRVDRDIAISQEDQAWLMELEQAVMKDLGNFNFTADMLASTMAMSRTTLFRRIRKLTGLTAQQYITEVRFRVAREWLEVRRFSTVKSVAHAAGLRDVEHFSRVFRDRFGKLPSAYLE